MSDETKELRDPKMIPVFARRVDGAGPMTEDEARKLYELVNEPQSPDQVDHPRHYTRGRIEVWDFIVDQRMGFLAGNVIKYLCRAGHKGDKLTDLKKARAYLDKLIQCEEQRDV